MMLSRIRGRLTYSNVVASMALFIALGGVSYAAVKLPKNSVGNRQIKKNAVTGSKVKRGSLSGSDIKNSSLTGSDIKNSSLTGSDLKSSSVTGSDVKDGSLTARDFSGSVQGPQGAKGEPGAPGPQGTRGVSSWDFLPSGTTVTGTQRIDLESPAPTGDYAFTVSLPGKAPQGIDDVQVNFASDARPETIDDDPACTGPNADPTAPPGKVCLYYGGILGLKARGDAVDVLRDQAFVVRWEPKAVGDTYLNFTWAYTAP